MKIQRTNTLKWRNKFAATTTTAVPLVVTNRWNMKHTFTNQKSKSHSMNHFYYYFTHILHWFPVFNFIEAPKIINISYHPNGSRCIRNPHTHTDHSRVHAFLYHQNHNFRGKWKCRFPMINQIDWISALPFQSWKNTIALREILQNYSHWKLKTLQKRLIK